MDRRTRRNQRARRWFLPVLATVIIAGSAATLGGNITASATPIVVTAAGDLGSSIGEIGPVADLSKTQNPSNFLLLGDLVYPDGEAAGYNSFFNTVYGPVKSKIIAAPGNHDYHQSGGSGFYGYFAGQAKWYGQDIGNGWRVENINTEENHSAGSPQEQWLKADLAANAGKHFLAITHHPRYTGGSSHGDDTALDAIVGDLDAAKADLFLAGHNHIYERFQPMGTNNSLRAEGQGVRFFTVGTGGNGLYSCTSHVGRQACIDTKHGALRLELNTDGFNWAFKTTDGQTLDAGTAPTRTGGSTTTTSSTSTSTSTSTTTTTTRPVTTFGPPIRAGFYYPWFPEAWNQNGITPYTHFTPSLGLYDSSDPAVIAEHIRNMQSAGLSAGIASWWGQGTPTDGRVNALLQGAASSDFKWSLYYEPEGIGNPTITQIDSDLKAISAKYAGNASYLHVAGKPVLFVYGNGTDNCNTADRWKLANAGRFYIVLKVFGGYTACTSQPDNWHQYAPGVRADSQGTHSYSISPGFWLRSESTPRLARDTTAFKTAAEAMVASKADFQLVTTFNEWGEGTSIEPAAEWGNTYLNILRNAITPPVNCTKHTGTQFTRITGTPPNTTHEYTNLLTGGCWNGGNAWLLNDYTTTPWETFHHSGAWNLRGPATVMNTVAVNYGDSYRAENGSDGFVFDSVLGLFGHDDCFENDGNNAGTIKNSICTSFVIYSAQGGTHNGSASTTSIIGSYLELKPTPTVYKGPDTVDNKYPAPGTGGFWKLDANSPKMVLWNNTFAASVIPNHQDLNPPATLVSCIGNKIIWKGTGEFPAKAAWLARCPDTTFA